MFNGVAAVVCLVLGAGLGVGYCLAVVKHYPDEDRKVAYMLTVLVFVVAAGALYLALSVRASVNSAITSYSTRIEQYLYDNHADNEFVRNGLDLKGVNDNIGEVNRAVADLKSILPSREELGVGRLAYGLIVDYAIKELQKRLTIVNYSAEVVNSFSDKDNVLTVKSVTGGLRSGATKLVNTVCLIICAVVVSVFLIYILYSLVVSQKARKSRAEDSAL